MDGRRRRVWDSGSADPGPCFDKVVYSLYSLYLYFYLYLVNEVVKMHDMSIQGECLCVKMNKQKDSIGFSISDTSKKHAVVVTTSM